ncbi:WSC domain-containing protein 1-like 3 [Homarus americanus]|uniref:WSC domain-containing protein 1-like 3 n=1 Tax=Homarus americanus TaxID=6706 RepID=A0A8J5K6C8_HOMAM|nr:WSC domain-containing protein 1-like 3 [Homarus americanus]
MAVDRGNVLLATTFFCVLMLQHYLQELPFGCSPSPCNDSTHTVSSRPSVHDHHPHAGQLFPLCQVIYLIHYLSRLPCDSPLLQVFSPGRCEGRGQEGDVLTGALHQRVVRRAGDNLRVNMTGPSWQPWREDDPGSPCVNYETSTGTHYVMVYQHWDPLRHGLPALGPITSWSTSTGTHYAMVYQHWDPLRHGLPTLGPINNTRRPTQPLDRLGGGMARVWLVSFPCSGNTWTRYLLEAVTGIFTGSFYNDDFLYKSDFHDFVETYVSHWEVIATDRLLWSSGPLYVLHYEHLLHNTTHHLRHLLHFLRVPVNEDRLACVSSHLTGPFKRSSNKDFDPFTTQEKIIMSTVVRRVTRLLLLLDYPPPPVYEWLS